MVDYTIYVLDESDLSIAIGELDGVNQGSGVHLPVPGNTLTINVANWTAIQITDNDNNFQDSDTSQVLNGAQEIDGTVYPSGSVVEAEYGFEVQFGTDVWQLIGFNVREAGAPNSYGTVEGIAVVSGPGDFPPVGEELMIISSQEGPNYSSSAYTAPVCFDAGSPILTPQGYVPVEELSVGDLVETADSGPQEIIWACQRRAFGIGAFAPVEIAAGVLGNTLPVRVSQQHRLLIRDPRASLMFDSSEVLVPAVSLVGREGVRFASGTRVHYHHILLENHALLSCGGLLAESFLPTPFGLSQLSSSSRASLHSAVPNFDKKYWQPARPLLRSFEAAALIAA
ncbi:MAG: Hint domain-containing protein [Pseudomonadota bacterium]